MVTDAIEEVHKEVVVTDGFVEEEVIIEDRRNLEQVVEGSIQEDITKTIYAEDGRLVSENGWLGLYNDKLYGANHQYYHTDFDVMACMDRVHLECPGMAQKYLNHHGRNKAQGVYFDMELSFNRKSLEQFATVLHKNDHLEDLSPVFYENKNLDQATFMKFVEGISKQRRLRRLSINLRWCDQVTDQWLEVLGKAI